MNNVKNKRYMLLIAAAVLLIIIIVSIFTINWKKEDKVKIGLILTGATTDEGWNGMHYQGVSSACKELGVELIVKENVAEGSGQCEIAIDELVKEDVGMIILSSYAYPEEVQETVQKYPQVSFYGISAEYGAENMTSYFGRMYQARYLAGIVAGMKTENNVIGYVAAMPNSEVNRGINAFTLGVKSVNPDATVNVVWTNEWENEEKESEAVDVLINELGADVLTYHQNQHYVAQKADEAGVYSIGYNAVAQGLSEKYLTAAVWDWNALYYQMIREYLQGKGNSVERHWFSLDTGVVALAECSELVDEETLQKIESAKQEMASGRQIFSGVIYDNNGTLQCDEGESISDEMLLKKMDWFVDGVVIYGE